MKKKNWRELFWYLVFGVATTLVDAAVFFFVVSLFREKTPEQTALINALATVVAWIAAVVFAFFTNKLWVFRDERWGWKTAFIQFGLFTVSRLATLGISVLISWLGTEMLLHWPWFCSLPRWIAPRTVLGRRIDLTNDALVIYAAKSVITMILNYLFSKLLIFRRKKTDQNP